jgi:hypothetical protein
MLAVLIYIVEALRRALRALVSSVWIVADSFHEARKMRQAMPRVYTEE